MEVINIKDLGKNRVNIKYEFNRMLTLANKEVYLDFFNRLS